MNLTEDCCDPEGNQHPAVIEHLERYRFAKKFCNGLEILDIACGAGYGSVMLLKEGNAKSVLGIDYSIKNINYCRSKYKYDNLNFMQGDICNISINKQYDLIVCYETIEHVLQTNDALKCLYALLSKDGKLIISTPNRKITTPYLLPNSPSMDGAHKREFTPEEFREIINNINFKVIAYYGQRLQKCFDNPFLEKYYKRYFKPDKRTSAIVEMVGHLEPKFIIFVLGK